MRRALLDACVLYPTTTRALLIGAAQDGLFEPFWSPPILEEWRRAAMRTGGDAGIEIALLQDRFRTACIAPVAVEATLPDRGDLHVLEAAIGAQADVIVTFNLKDFPARTLARHGLLRAHTDAFLTDLAAEHLAVMARIAETARSDAARAFGRDIGLRTLLKKCHLPRLGKLLG